MSDAPPIPVAESSLRRGLHINYFLLASNSLPSHYVGLDSSRVSAIYFIVIALDLLDALDVAMKARFIESIYHLQLYPRSSQDIENGVFGFIGGSFLNNEAFPDLYHESNVKYRQGHLAMIYTALASLITLGDDLSRVEVEPIRKGLSLLQCPDGSFLNYLHEGETDVRFVYCACAIATMLDIWSSINIEAAAAFVRRCLTYEGGFGLRPGWEAHGGGTYCAVASLALMGQLDSLTDEERSALIAWCEQRQVGGYQGRTNKDADSCYAFWVGASLHMLGAFENTDFASTRDFILHTCQVQSKSGGFRKMDGAYPDILHSYYSLCWLAMAGELKPLDPRLAIVAEKAAPVHARVSSKCAKAGGSSL